MAGAQPLEPLEPLDEYLGRPMSPPVPEVLAAIEAGPLNPVRALRREHVQRLADPAPMEAETGWCTLADGVGYVAVRTEMPGVSGEMVDWWFDWHPREAIRYRVWHPAAHRGNSVEEPARAGEPRAKAHWHTIHRPVEDVGVGIVNARIEFLPPSQMGFDSDMLTDERVATVVCGLAGDEQRRMRHTPMYHVFLRTPTGVTLRSVFYLGAAMRPYGPLGGVGERLLNRRAVRRRTLPRRLPAALARHCAEEYANLAALLPELHARFGASG